MLARVSHLSASCIHLRGSHHLSKRPPGCVLSRASVRTPLISVKTCCTAERSGEQAAAVLSPSTVARNPKVVELMSAAEGCLRFINYAWTQYHAVEEASRRLSAVGFQKLSEKQEWKLKPGGRYYFTRNLSTIVAFAVGAKYQPGNGLHMIGAHTDSPCLKLKPVSKSIKSGYLTVNVETYGGGLWHTWFDRDLSVAGRVLVKQGGQLQHKLVKIEKPIMRIPMLAIHLNRDILSKGFELNKQTHLVPVLASAVQKAANKPAAPSSNGSHVEADGQNKRQKVDGAGDAADLAPKTAKVSTLCSSALAYLAHTMV
ncbi:hypothetical protein ABBQ32_004627 [Trebouxia sp. C0010 RCD-2024]